ncbi:MAG: TlpA family protein disulfide reductase [Nitrospinae bacterium]|nr:TlpA family protein disulfide reductase [Nitrospinota bacterium]
MTWRGYAICALMPFTALASCQEEAAPAPSGPPAAARQAGAVPRQTPDVSLIDLDGKTRALAEFRGAPVLVNFWASWCVPCLAEMPEIERFGNTKRAEGLKLAMINLEEPPAVIRNFLREYDYKFPALLDTDGAVARAFGVTGLPTSFFLDAKGIIRYERRGRMTTETLEEGYRKAREER